MGSGERVSARGLAVLTGVLAAACATTPMVATGEGYRHRELGYTIAAPPPGGGPWRSVRVEGADLAFRGSEGVRLSLLSRCRGTRAAPRIQARNLTIGLGELTPLAAGPISLGGAPGWAQSFELDGDGARIRLHSVTLVDGGCTFDWLLTGRAPGSAAGAPDEDAWRAALDSFDAWWRSFRFTPRRESATEGGA